MSYLSAFWVSNVSGVCLFLQFFDFVSKFHFIQCHKELYAVYDEIDDELEPYEEGKETEKGAIGYSHGGDEDHAPAIYTGGGQPETCHYNGRQSSLSEGWGVGMRREYVETSKPYDQHHEG